MEKKKIPKGQNQFLVAIKRADLKGGRYKEPVFGLQTCRT